MHEYLLWGTGRPAACVCHTQDTLAVVIILINTCLIAFFLYVATQHFLRSVVKKIAPKVRWNPPAACSPSSIIHGCGGGGGGGCCGSMPNIAIMLQSSLCGNFCRPPLDAAELPSSTWRDGLVEAADNTPGSASLAVAYQRLLPGPPAVGSAAEATSTAAALFPRSLGRLSEVQTDTSISNSGDSSSSNSSNSSQGRASVPLLSVGSLINRRSSTIAAATAASTHPFLPQQQQEEQQQEQGPRISQRLQLVQLHSNSCLTAGDRRFCGDSGSGGLSSVTSTSLSPGGGARRPGSSTMSHVCIELDEEESSSKSHEARGREQVMKY
jgi:hypothetical protein